MLWCLSRWPPDPLSGWFLTHRGFYLSPAQGDVLSHCWISRGYRAAKEIIFNEEQHGAEIFIAKFMTTQKFPAQLWNVKVLLPWSPWLANTPCCESPQSSPSLYTVFWSTVLLQKLNSCSAGKEISPNFIEPECSLLCLQEIATGTVPEPDESNPYNPIMFKIYVNSFL